MAKQRVSSAYDYGSPDCFGSGQLNVDLKRKTVIKASTLDSSNFKMMQMSDSAIGGAEVDMKKLKIDFD